VPPAFNAVDSQPEEIEMTDMLIENGFIATMDRGGKVYRRGSLYARDDRIVEVGEEIDVPHDPEVVIDARHRVVLPGFVNAHAHLQQYFRGVYELIGEFYKVNLPLEGYRRPDDMASLGLASCAEFIYGGCTTALVIYTYPDGFARAVEKAGNRCILAADIEEVDLNRLSQGIYAYLPDKGAAAFERATDLYNDWHGKAQGRITTVMAPKAPDLATAETYRKCKAFADEHGLRVTTHLSQSWREVQQVKRLYGKTPPQHLHDLGVLDARLTGAHCTYVTQKDIQLIADSGMGILHCRAVTNPLVRWMDQGIPLALGTDDYHHDMLQLLRQNIAGQAFRARLIEGAEEMLAGNRTIFRPTAYELLELATRRGAETLGIDGQVGSLEPGKKADIITVNMHTPYLTPTRDPLTSVVLYGSAADVDTVIVDGKILKRDGVLATVNLAEVLTTAQSKVEEIIDRFFREHPQQQAAWEQKAPYMT
jgi:5-methylthioadenosine/S-adenosylhomocysteine deaminase